MEKKNGSIRQVLKFTLFSASAGIIQIAAFAILEIFIRTTGYLMEKKPT